MAIANLKRVFLLAAVSLIFIQCKEKNKMDELVYLLMETDMEFSKASKELGAAEAFYKFADESALMLSKNSEPIRGKNNVLEAMKGMEGAVLTWMPEEGMAAGSGDMGYTWGRFEYKFTDAEGKNQMRVGKYVSIWKRQADKSWKWIVDIGNTDDPK